MWTGFDVPHTEEPLTPVTLETMVSAAPLFSCERQIITRLLLV